MVSAWSAWKEMLNRSSRYDQDIFPHEGIDIFYGWINNFERFKEWFDQNTYEYTGAYGVLSVNPNLFTKSNHKYFHPLQCCMLPSKINDKVMQMCRGERRNERSAIIDEILGKFIADETTRGEVPERILSELETLRGDCNL